MLAEQLKSAAAIGIHRPVGNGPAGAIPTTVGPIPTESGTDPHNRHLILALKPVGIGPTSLSLLIEGQIPVNPASCGDRSRVRAGNCGDLSRVVCGDRSRVWAMSVGIGPALPVGISPAQRRKTFARPQPATI